MFRKLIVLLLLVVCLGCHATGKPVATDNETVQVELLFTDNNGNKVYRFMDSGNYHYYAVSKNGDISIGR